jgi:hypothetical protein
MEEKIPNTLNVITVGHICDLKLIPDTQLVTLSWDDDLGKEGFFAVGFRSIGDISDELKGIDVKHISAHVTDLDVGEFDSIVLDIWIKPSNAERDKLYEWVRRANRAGRRYIRDSVDEFYDLDD